MGFTPFELVGFGVVSNVWGLGFCYLHLTVFLSFGESKVFLVPLQTRAKWSANDPTPHGLAIVSIVTVDGLKDLDRRIKPLTVDCYWKGRSLGSPLASPRTNDEWLDEGEWFGWMTCLAERDREEFRKESRGW